MRFFCAFIFLLVLFSSSVFSADSTYGLKSEIPLSNFHVFKAYKVDDSRVFFEFRSEGNFLVYSDFILVLDAEKKPTVYITFYGEQGSKKGAPAKFETLANGNFGVYMMSKLVLVDEVIGGWYYRDKLGTHKITFSAEKPPALEKPNSGARSQKR